MASIEDINTNEKTETGQSQVCKPVIIEFAYEGEKIFLSHDTRDKQSNKLPNTQSIQKAHLGQNFLLVVAHWAKPPVNILEGGGIGLYYLNFSQGGMISISVEFHENFLKDKKM